MAKSIIPGGNNRERCFLCGRYGPTQRHHCLNGPDRKMADRDGLTVQLCPECHRRLHDKGEHYLELKQVAQRAFEARYSRDLWMGIYGRNYLD